jgi:bifunctional non-homologous end joining protein LigD
VDYTFGQITITCTNVDRVMFPDAGITKGELLAYYHDVADVMLPELRDRALTIERFTKGIDKGGFFQKHAQKHYPAWIRRIELGGKTRVVYPYVDGPASLVYFANQGGITMHVWTSRVATPERPDQLVFDLDPPEGRFDLVREAALLLRELFAALELPAFVKTTGSKGLHVIAPLDGHAPYDEVAALGNTIAAVMCRRHPDRFTTEFYKKDRKGRLFLDTMRNSMGATIVAAYTVRGRPGAPVSAPIEWTEVGDPGLRPDGITLRDLRARLDRIGDPWSGMRRTVGSIEAAAAALARLRD